MVLLPPFGLLSLEHHRRCHSLLFGGRDLPGPKGRRSQEMFLELICNDRRLHILGFPSQDPVIGRRIPAGEWMGAGDSCGTPAQAM